MCVLSDAWDPQDSRSINNAGVSAHDRSIASPQSAHPVFPICNLQSSIAILYASVMGYERLLRSRGQGAPWGGGQPASGTITSGTSRRMSSRPSHDDGHFGPQHGYDRTCRHMIERRTTRTNGGSPDFSL